MIAAALVALAVTAGAYLAGVARLARRGDAWRRARLASGLAGLAALAASLLVEHLPVPDFQGHILQHLLLAMVAPALLALSAPVTLALRTLPRAGRHVVLAVLHSRAVRLLTRAPVFLLLQAGGGYVYYLTPLFAAADRQPLVHLAVHAHMFLAGCLLSWYLVGIDPLPSRPSTRTALLVLAVSAASHDVLAKLMYARAVPHDAGTVAQIRAGAQLLYYGGDVVEVALATVLMLAWFRRTGRELARHKRRALAA